MSKLTIYTIEMQGYSGEPVRLCTAAYTQPQAKALFADCPYAVTGREPLMRMYDHMPKNVQKQYAKMIEEPCRVFAYEFATGTWRPLHD